MGLHVHVTDGPAPTGRRAGKKMTTQLTGPTINFIYNPGAGDTSTKIVFIQVMRELLDGVASLPSTIDASFSYQDADSTPVDLYHVDYVSGEKDCYYNGDDPGLDFGPQGHASQSQGDPAVAARTNDTPNYLDASFPDGKSTLKWEFRTAAFSAAGDDQGTYYQYAHWSYTKTKGSPGRLHILDGGVVPGPKFRAAVDLWCKNHGFTLPTPLPPDPEPDGMTYVVKPGDYLSKIAKAFYGDGNKWPTIYAANKAVIGPDPNKIYPGQELVIP
jgi:LysM repeat protein